MVKRSFVLRIKFSGGRQFSSPKSPTSCSCKTLSEMRAAFGFKSSGMGLDLLAVQAVGLSVHSEGGGDGQERRGTQEPAAYARED